MRTTRNGRVLGLAGIYLALATVSHGACPPVPDRQAEIAAIYERLQAAPNEQEARRISNELWIIWSEAPDDYAQSLLDEGMAKREVYDFAGAVETFDVLTAYCPHYAEGWNQRAFVRFLRGEYAEAVTDLETALALNPAHVGAMAGQALTLLSLGRIKAGQSVLKEALELNPWLPERAYLIEEPG